MEEEKKIYELLEDYALHDKWDEAEGFVVVAFDRDGPRRRTQMITIVIRSPSGRFYQTSYDCALTEMQDSSSWEIPVEVRPVEKTVTITNYVKV